MDISTFAIAAAISTENYPLYLEIEGFLKNLITENISKKVTAYAELCLATAYVGAMAPNIVPDWLKNGDFTSLHPLTRQDAAYQRTRYLQCIGNYEAMLAVAQTALSFQVTGQRLTPQDIYLRIVCAMACFPLGRANEVKSWLLEAMNLALPNGLITPFAETVVDLDGLVEQCLRDEFPMYYDAVISQWKRTFPNWVSFHNRFASDNITQILSHAANSFTAPTGNQFSGWNTEADYTLYAQQEKEGGPSESSDSPDPSDSSESTNPTDPSNPADPAIPDTGGNSNPWILLAVMAFSMGDVVITVNSKRHRKKTPLK